MRVRSMPLLAVLLVLWGSVSLFSFAPLPEGAAAISSDKIREHIRHLASEELTGRGVGTPGLAKAADYIAQEFARCGLAPAGAKGTYFQDFPATMGVTLGENNYLRINGAQEFAVEKDWVPLSFSSSGEVAGDVVFAGYGVSSPQPGYDDYAGIDAAGKIVLVLRYEPPSHKDGKDSPFGGPQHPSRLSDLRYKALTARKHGAKALLIVTGPLSKPGEKEKLISPYSDAGSSAKNIFVAHITRTVAQALVAVSGQDLETLQREIDDRHTPQSLPLAGVTAALGIDLRTQEETLRNVIGTLAGADPQLGHETVVIGAHYDHLGLGKQNSLDPDRAGTVHPGADDNASGTAALMEIACAFHSAPARPLRALTFVAFSGEEIGLAGSSYYVHHPTFPLDKTMAMLNLDMVGRMQRNKLIVFGTGTAKEFPPLLAEVNRSAGLSLVLARDGFGPSDQTPFYGESRPVLHFFTGAHEDYHRPTDTWEKINATGAGQAARFVYATAHKIANRAQPLSFLEETEPEPRRMAARAGGYGPYLGIIPDFTRTRGGVLIGGVRKGSPAEKAGLQKGDTIIRFGRIETGDLYDLTYALQEQKPGDAVELKVRRQGKEFLAKAVLAKRR